MSERAQTSKSFAALSTSVSRKQVWYCEVTVIAACLMRHVITECLLAVVELKQVDISSHKLQGLSNRHCHARSMPATQLCAMSNLTALRTDHKPKALGHPLQPEISRAVAASLLLVGGGYRAVPFLQQRLKVVTNMLKHTFLRNLGL